MAQHRGHHRGHRLHAIGAEFALHYSCSRRADAGFLEDLRSAPWGNRVHLHFSDENNRADFSDILHYRDGAHVYACGADGYMAAVMQAAEAAGTALAPQIEIDASLSALGFVQLGIALAIVDALFPWRDVRGVVGAHPASGHAFFVFTPSAETPSRLWYQSATQAGLGGPIFVDFTPADEPKTLPGGDGVYAPHPHALFVWEAARGTLSQRR